MKHTKNKDPFSAEVLQALPEQFFLPSGETAANRGGCDWTVLVFWYVMCVRWYQHECQEANVSQQYIALKQDGRSSILPVSGFNVYQLMTDRLLLV